MDTDNENLDPESAKYYDILLLGKCIREMDENGKIIDYYLLDGKKYRVEPPERQWIPGTY